FQYKVDNYYAPEAEASIMYNDETIGIKWPLSPEEFILSRKDTEGLAMTDPEIDSILFP
ncbi:MAG: dTDP-4-dehydrorhamnose 3,5-epimerase, partial [Muribaculaceae bacterium]|nr:dTDP-4-dehydrorhamnose 3,5-epimerase [Muribaculaceae bacterium]